MSLLTWQTEQHKKAANYVDEPIGVKYRNVCAQLDDRRLVVWGHNNKFIKIEIPMIDKQGMGCHTSTV